MPKNDIEMTGLRARLNVLAHIARHGRVQKVPPGQEPPPDDVPGDDEHDLPGWAKAGKEAPPGWRKVDDTFVRVGPDGKDVSEEQDY